MTEEELIEQLASCEHESWSRWMSYLIGEKCETVEGTDGHSHLCIPNEPLGQWERQIQTPYAELTEREKQSDRDEVSHILPIINEYVRGDTTAYEKLNEEQKATVNEFRTRISNMLFENLEPFYKDNPDLVFSWGLTLNVSLREDKQEPQEL
jgi:hypothetical protein